jgi:hypothetical protein
VRNVLAIGAAVSPIVLAWAFWIEHFEDDADFAALFEIVTTGFTCAFDDSPQKWYQVDNHVPNEHKPVVAKGECTYKHACENCGSKGHGSSNCTQADDEGAAGRGRGGGDRGRGRGRGHDRRQNRQDRQDRQLALTAGDDG